MARSRALTPRVRGEKGVRPHPPSCITDHAAGEAKEKLQRSKTPPAFGDEYCQCCLRRWSPPPHRRSSSADSLADLLPPTAYPKLTGSGVLRSPGMNNVSQKDSKKCPCRVSFSGVIVVAPPGSPLISESTDVDECLANFRAEPHIGWIGTGVSDPLLPRGDPLSCRGRLNELKTSQIGMRLRAAYLGVLVAGIVAILCLGLIDRTHEGAVWFKAAEIAVTVAVVLEVAFRIWLEGSVFWTSCSDVLDAIVALVCVAAIVVSYVPAYTRLTGTRSEEKYFAFAMRVTRDIMRLLKLMMQLYYLPY
eukprot:Hpha_TRINITY_DN15844_c1_g3::TRINITY_DN15844_c1_g3_i1::g.187194::m.187194